MASTPFLYFTDHNPELGRLVTEGRRKEFAGFAGFADPETVARIPDPQAERTFNASKLNWEEIGEGMHHVTHTLYKEALRLRRELTARRMRTRDAWEVVALGERTVALTSTNAQSGATYTMVVNLRGGDMQSVEISRGLAELVFSSNERRFGGSGLTAYDAKDHRLRFDRPELLVLRSTGLSLQA